MDVPKKLEVLMEFAELDGTEWGEMLQSLNSLYSCRSVISPELAEAIDQEISNNYEWAVDNLEIITETVMVPRETKRLEQIE